MYSNIYELKKGMIIVYNLRNFKEAVVLDLAEELKKGQRRIELPSLFKPAMGTSRSELRPGVIAAMSIPQLNLTPQQPQFILSEDGRRGKLSQGASIEMSWNLRMSGLERTIFTISLAGRMREDLCLSSSNSKGVAKSASYLSYTSLLRMWIKEQLSRETRRLS